MNFLTYNYTIFNQGANVASTPPSTIYWETIGGPVWGAADGTW